MEPSRLDSFRAWFADYCRSFYSADEADNRNIRLKEMHTYQVCAIMERLAVALALPEDDRLLAAAVALFHDLGRFEQYRRYKTFKDAASLNHATLGARILTEQRVLEPLSPEERLLIGKAVALHNVFRLPDALDERSLLHLKLIRDADKLDIWRVFCEYFDLPAGERPSAVGLGFADLPECSAAVIDAVSRGELVNLTALRTLNDFTLLQLSWVYDLNFGESSRLLIERHYLERLAATLPDSAEVRQAVAAVRTYARRFGGVAG
ncbi:HD family phosphohydrolase [Geotalea uraniireducens]|uniref:HD family phosphohydrolase n=1 Tax=Geotalea uraniireducens TaxID=351604 RepID=A0ABN6VWB7_9BACT|nr:HD domain-containing protein [Geotalea uraniireducens]BDV42510.1 HD family phosphohydrolase [Geotalea uraniireducens]